MEDGEREAGLGRRTHAGISRRRLLGTATATLAISCVRGRTEAFAPPREIKLPDNLPVKTFDWESKGIEGWSTVDGQWVVEEMAGAPAARRSSSSAPRRTSSTSSSRRL